VASGPEEMTPEQLLAIRARLEEPPPLLALAERHQGSTALAQYLKRLQDDRIALVDEVDRLRSELAEQNTPKILPGTA
jgi:septal ring factor EnvC (AmiA/AmiB activator)